MYKSLEMNFVLDLLRTEKIIKIMPFFEPLEWHYPLINQLSLMI